MHFVSTGVDPQSTTEEDIHTYRDNSCSNSPDFQQQHIADQMVLDGPYQL